MTRQKKTEIVQVFFSGIADKGLAVGRAEDGRVVFSKGPVPGDVAEVLLTKKTKGVYQGVVKKIQVFSEYREEPFCAHFESCGGCKWQHLRYERQLFEKEKQVRDAFQRIAKTEPRVFLPVKGSEQTFDYRNKLEFSFSSRRWLTSDEINKTESFEPEDALGFHAPGSFDKIVQIDQCFLQAEPSNSIRNFVRKFTKAHGYPYWDAKKHTGLMRNMIIRTSTAGESMVVVVFSSYDTEKIPTLLNALREEFPQISSIQYVINTKMNDSLQDQDFVLFFGKAEITEKLGGLEFSISPKSFFQTNTLQTKVLYDIALDFADLKGDEVVFDLYTGLGSIALYLAHKVRQVIGVELVEEAIADAKKNAERNQIANTGFFAGDVRDVIKTIKSIPDVIFVDPPRSGLHAEVVETILSIAPKKIIYISCNPSTQARDVALFSVKYNLDKLQAVDMFPHTHHIESVCSLNLK